MEDLAQVTALEEEDPAKILYRAKMLANLRNLHASQDYGMWQLDMDAAGADLQCNRCGGAVSYAPQAHIPLPDTCRRCGRLMSVSWDTWRRAARHNLSRVSRKAAQKRIAEMHRDREGEN